MSSIRTRLAAGVLAAALAGGAAGAADLGPPFEPMDPEEFDRRWSFGFGLYGWATRLDATVAAFGAPPANVNATFSDILEDLDFAAMAVGEARYDRFGVFADLVYASITAEGSLVDGLLDARLEDDLVIGTLMGQYRAAEQGRTSLDLMAGARIWHVGLDLDLSTPLSPATLSVDEDQTWVDPMVGAKGRLQGDSPFYLTGWAMIGGFGVSSEVAWDALGAVGYEVTDWISLIAGYRALGVDFQDDDFMFDASLHGPVVSGVLRF